MNNITEKILKKGGAISFDDLSNLDHNADIIEIVDDLKEDLLQAFFPGEMIIDIGWYPEFCKSGSFRVLLIADQNWDNPTFSRKARSWIELDAAINNVLHKLTTAKF